MSEGTSARDIIARVNREDAMSGNPGRRSRISNREPSARRQGSGQTSRSSVQPATNPESATRNETSGDPSRVARHAVRDETSVFPRQERPESANPPRVQRRDPQSLSPGRKTAHPATSRPAPARPRKPVDIKPMKKPLTTSQKVVNAVLDGIVDIGVIFLCLLASFAFHLYVIMPYIGARQESESINALQEQWGDPAVPTNNDAPPAPANPIPRPGDHEVFATMRIPALDTPSGPWQYTITSGATIADMRTGVGWYNNYIVDGGDGSSSVPAQLPGEKGNFATAAHRDGSTAPYQEINTLKTCDEIIVDTAGGSYTYKVLPINPDSPDDVAKWNSCATGMSKEYKPNLYGNLPGQHIVSPYDVNVINPIPGLDGLQIPDWAVPMITLTSCHPRNSNEQRIIVHAVLDSSTARS